MPNTKKRSLFEKNSIKILIPTDLVSPAQMITPALSHLSKKIQLEIGVIHVAPKYWKIPLLRNIESNAPLELSLQHWGKKLPKGDNPISFHLCRGNVAEEIIHLSNKLRTNLILIEENNKVKTYENEPGLLTRQLIRYSNKPVWVCKTKKMSKILCAIDGSKPSKTALTSAIELAKKFSCHLTVLHVFPEVDFNPSGLDEHIVRKFESEFERKCTNKIDRFLQKTDLQSLKRVKKIYHKGLPASIILEMSEKNKIDLIVIGAKGHSLLHDLFVGSTAEKVIPFTPCSLLVTI